MTDANDETTVSGGEWKANEPTPEITMGPFIAGVLQGFVSVGVKKYKERKAANKAQKEEEEQKKQAVES